MASGPIWRLTMNNFNFNFNDVEAEVNANFDSFRDQLVSYLAYKWQAREVEWLEPALVCRPFNSPWMCKHVLTGFPYIMHFNIHSWCQLHNGWEIGNLLCHCGSIQWHLIERSCGIVPLIEIVLYVVSARTIRRQWAKTEGTKIKWSALSVGGCVGVWSPCKWVCAGALSLCVCVCVCVWSVRYEW
jgi:hypothetical protein